MKQNRPSPKVFIGYDRIAYAGIEDPEFRITFDRNIRYRLHDLDLRSGDHGDPVTDDDTVVMEVKIKDAMPLWLVPILSSNRIYPGSFSSPRSSCRLRKSEKLKRLKKLRKSRSLKK